MSSFDIDNKGNGKSISSRLFKILTEPHEKVLGTRKKQQIRLLSCLLLAAIPFFGYAFIFTDMTPSIQPLLLCALIGISFLYLLSRTTFYDLSLYIGLTLITVIPPMVFLFYIDWLPNDLPRIIIWLLVALIAGGLLTQAFYVVCQGVFFITIVSISITMKGYTFLEIASHFGGLVIVTILLIISSYILEMTMNQFIESTQDTERRRLELEVYAQLLRHDLRNDLQAIIGSIELADAFLDINIELTREHIDRCMAVGDSMVNLLNVFNIHEEIPSGNLVELIQSLAESAEYAYPGMVIDVRATSVAKEINYTSSRLMPLVWNNIFRNAAQHCGEKPRIIIDIAVVKDMFEVIIQDNGPGIPEIEKAWLFKRGKETDSGERGLGLYLSSVIIKSQDGTIDLYKGDEYGGAGFIIRLPLNPI